MSLSTLPLRTVPLTQDGINALLAEFNAKPANASTMLEALKTNPKERLKVTDRTSKSKRTGKMMVRKRNRRRKIRRKRRKKPSVLIRIRGSKNSRRRFRNLNLSPTGCGMLRSG